MPPKKPIQNHFIDLVILLFSAFFKKIYRVPQNQLFLDGFGNSLVIVYPPVADKNFLRLETKFCFKEK